MRTYSTYDEAIYREIEEAIGSEYLDMYDIDAIANRTIIGVFDWGGQIGYRFDPEIDPEQFWEIASEHEISQAAG